jgi:hypothetical protein
VASIEAAEIQVLYGGLALTGTNRAETGLRG